jgi:hypothetical protein
MKTAISIPTPLFREAEKAARKLGLSRSEFFARAAARLVDTLGDEQITASYDAAFATDEDEEDVAFRREAARRTILSVEWNEGEQASSGPAASPPRSAGRKTKPRVQRNVGRKSR